MVKVDHHLHTTRYSPDSIMTPRDLVERAAAIGLDAVVITEHDAQWGEEELAALAALAGPVKVFSGVEVSAREGHFLVYGLPHLNDVEPGIPLGDLLKVVRGRRAAVVAAHPYRWDQEFDAIYAEHGPALDALELVSNNVTPETRAKTARLLARAQAATGASGSSDGHEPEALGCYYSEFPGPIDTMADFVAALHARSGRPRHRPGAWQSSGPVD